MRIPDFNLEFPCQCVCVCVFMPLALLYEHLNQVSLKGNTIDAFFFHQYHKLRNDTRVWMYVI